MPSSKGLEMTHPITPEKPMITWDRTVGLACILAAAAVMSACGEEAATPTTSAPTDDTASAYEALSASLQACEERQDACTTAASGDATKLASCESEAAGCKQKTEAAADHARENLARDTNACWKKCRHGDDDAGAVSSEDDGGTDDMQGCVEHHAPRLPRCVLGLLSCLQSSGIRKGDATREELVTCIQAADTCFRDEFKARREEARGDRGRRGDEAGTGAAGGTPVTSPAAGGAGGAAAAGRGGAAAAGRSGDKNPFSPGGNRGGDSRGRH
jgi:hypothetical protein